MPILVPKYGLLRPHGTVHVTGCDGPEYVRDTISCVHCGAHGVFSPGCGKKLAHCPKCDGPTCGRESCRECIGPLEKRLDLYESGKLATL